MTIYLSKTNMAVASKPQPRLMLSKTNLSVATKPRPRLLISKTNIAIGSRLTLDAGDPLFRLKPRRKLLLGISQPVVLVNWPDPIPAAIADLNIVGSPTATTITLGFTPVQYADYYEFQLDSDAWVLLPTDHVIPGLTPETLYLVQLRGVNETGAAQPSNQIEVTTLAIPIDDTPPVITSPATSSAVEGTAFGGTVTANEPSIFSVSGADAAAVTLDPETGAWTLESTDYETQASYAWTFEATDAAGNIGTQDYVHTVTDNAADNPYPLTVVLAGGLDFDGFVGGFSDVPRQVTTDGGMSYMGSGGVAPYTYDWELYGSVHLTSSSRLEAVDDGLEYPVPTNPNGGYTKFVGTIPWTFTAQSSLMCTITDAVGNTTSFIVNITLTNADYH